MSTVTHDTSVVKRPRHSPWPIIPMCDAERIVDEYFEPGTTEVVAVTNVNIGDVLAEDVVATVPHPEVRTSIKDGYAVIASDGPGVRDVVHQTTAGTLASIKLKSGTICRVSTGSMVPDGADAVVQVEDTHLIKHDDVEEISVEILSTPAVGQDIRNIGSDVAVGDLVLPKHTVFGSAEIGLLAGSDRKTVQIFKKPKIAVMSTGHELVDVHSRNRPLGQVIDTNRPQLMALFKSCGAHPVDIGIVPDSVENVSKAIEEAFSIADIVVSSGGVSMGEKDYLKAVIQEHFKFKIHFGRVMMKPGLPTTFATGLWNDRKKAILALPGNPVSAWVTAQIFVVPALRKVAGYCRYQPTVIRVKTTEPIKLEGRPEYRRAWIQKGAGDVPEAVCTDTNQLSSRLLSLRSANLLLRLPAKTDGLSQLQTGEIVDALIIGPMQ